MGASRAAGAGLVRFLNDIAARGVREALRTFDLERLAGRPIEEVFAALSDYICPEGGTIDEGIARDAFIETIDDLAQAGITNMDGLTLEQMKTVFELYATHAIEARLCNDVGTRIVTLPADASAVQRIENQLGEFIRRAVSDALNSSTASMQSLPTGAVPGFVNDIYQSAFEFLEAMGEAEAER